MTLQIHQFPCLSDNYGFLIHDPATGETACIDTPDAEAYLREADAKGWRITQIWNTHWHPDHTGGNQAIFSKTHAQVCGPGLEHDRIPVIDRTLHQGDRLGLGSYTAHVLDVSGHTMGHVAFYFPEAAVAFVGDALFPLGCGRMFEGTPDQFWASLLRLKALPPGTTLYSAHEYTQSNARFALHADPDNVALKSYAAQVDSRRAQGQWTVPTTLEAELAANPFLRADTPEMAVRWGGSSATETFAALRAAKDTFR